MNYFTDGLHLAWHLIVHPDSAFMQILWVTLKVAAIPTAIATIVGLPLGLALGLGRFRGRTVLVVLANAGLALPPVVIGLVFLLLLLPSEPLGSTRWLFTLHGVYLAQTVLAFPVIIALTTSAVRAISPGLLEQARAFGAGRVQLAILALREARIGVLAAIIAAVGSALSEVAAVLLVGGNIQGLDQTLASAALQQIDQGNFRGGLAYGFILIALILIVVAILTVLQQGGSQGSRAMGRAG